MTVADRIKNLRMELGMSQAELAAKIGIKNKSSICKIESHGNNITLKDIARIAEALNTTSAFLLGWEDEFGNTIPDDNDQPKDIQQLLDDFSKLTKDQQLTVLALIHSMTPDKK